MDNHRLGFAFEHELADFAFEHSVNSINYLFGSQHLGSEVLIQTVHARSRVDGISRWAILVMIAGANVAEKNLSRMDAHTGWQMQIIQGSVEAMHGFGDVESRQTRLAS